MNKKDTRKPAAFKVEEIEVFAPPVPASSEPMPVPAPRLRTAADLGRGLRWGTILISALFLLRASNWQAVLFCVGLIGVCTPLFWFLIRAMARLQMPSRTR